MFSPPILFQRGRLAQLSAPKRLRSAAAQPEMRRGRPPRPSEPDSPPFLCIGATVKYKSGLAVQSKLFRWPKPRSRRRNGLPLEQSVPGKNVLRRGGADVPFWEPGFESPGATATPASKRMSFWGLGKCPDSGSIDRNNTGLPILGTVLNRVVSTRWRITA